MSLYRLAQERGYVVEEVEVALGDGKTRPGWQVYDLAAQEFVQEAVNWATPAQCEAYIEESS